jgi:hypothetical protein
MAMSEGVTPVTARGVMRWLEMPPEALKAANLNALAGEGYDFRFGSLTFGPIAWFQYTDDGQVGRTNYDSHGVICSAHFDF